MFTADSLRLQGGIQKEFGNFGMRYSSGNDRLEIADKINSTTSYIPRGNAPARP
jgi:hypothetical protein